MPNISVADYVKRLGDARKRLVLVKWSLVDFMLSVKDEGGRYRLHDLARNFAGSRLEELEQPQAILLSPPPTSPPS